MKTKFRKISIYSLLFFVPVILLYGCLRDDSLARAEKKQIELYIKALGDTVYDLKPSGLYYIELKTGTGISPLDNDTVVIKGRGLYLDYTQFLIDPENTPNKFVVGSGAKIKGIEEGVKYMKVGGKSRLLTPSSLSYGYSPLLWEINLISVARGPGNMK
jgi:FKBP-type peptidyl-prolyl cis-trans isomerase